MADHARSPGGLARKRERDANRVYSPEERARRAAHMREVRAWRRVYVLYRLAVAQRAILGPQEHYQQAAA